MDVGSGIYGDREARVSGGWRSGWNFSLREKSKKWEKGSEDYDWKNTEEFKDI